MELHTSCSTELFIANYRIDGGTGPPSSDILILILSPCHAEKHRDIRNINLSDITLRR